MTVYLFTKIDVKFWHDEAIRSDTICSTVKWDINNYYLRLLVTGFSCISPSTNTVVKSDTSILCCVKTPSRYGITLSNTQFTNHAVATMKDMVLIPAGVF